MPRTDELSPLLELCEAAAKLGGAELLRLRGTAASREKAPRDFVTDADLASQEAIRRVVADAYPEHGFLGEESEDFAQLESEYCWVVDPLDGTTNYVHDFPFFAVSVAVCFRGQVVAGAVFDPLRQECFAAALGHGAELNGQPIRASETTEINEALVAASLPPQVSSDDADLNSMLRVSPACRAIRRTGSAALNLAYVASGRMDAHWAHSIRPWDAAAGVLLITEAGGVVTSSTGGDFRIEEPNYLAAATGELHSAVLALLA
ncbi:MAG: inositol monophosphatase family protein [Planctomycetota bacterium]